MKTSIFTLVGLLALSGIPTLSLSKSWQEGCNWCYDTAHGKHCAPLVGCTTATYYWGPTISRTLEKMSGGYRPTP